MTLLWSSANGSERGSSCDGTLQSLQPQDPTTTAAAAARLEGHAQNQDAVAKEALHLDPYNKNDIGTKWSSEVIGMGNPFGHLTRPSSPSRSSVVVRQASASASTSEQQEQLQPTQEQHTQQARLDHHTHAAQSNQQNDPASSQHSSNHHSFHYASSPASTSGNGERSTKRLKLTVRKPTIASPTTRNGRGAKKDGDSSSAPNNAMPRPPTRLTLAEPHGDILQTTNGVQTLLNITQDGLGLRTDNSRATTAEPTQKTARKSSDRRSLRSHDEGPRLKSELAVYFPDYEEIIYDAPKEPELLNMNTVIVISDKPYNAPDKFGSNGTGKIKPEDKDKDKTTAGQRQLTSPRRSHASTITIAASPSHDRNRFNGAQVVDFSSIEKSVGHHPRDPLTDSFYFKSHRRAERKEKQLRNIEKERAMHEKAQLERLLDSLQSHDWLRMMGITGVTDAEAKKFEPKRDYFISEMEALLLKFKTWRAEERRLRLEKEAVAAAEEEAKEDDEGGDQGGVESENDGDPSSSDFDGAAARQLQMEASGGAKGQGGKGGKGKQRERAPQQPAPPPVPVVYRPPTPDGPFTSFYAKPHMRAAALGKARHGRNLTAFGLPIPELEDKEFALPGDYVTREALKESARRRRRLKRESKVDGSANK